MNPSTAKKRARELQAITGMAYQAAHRAVVAGTEYQASIRSGLGLSDFVTPRELRIWHQVNGTGALDCANHRHWMPEEALGQCVGCGAYLVQEFDDYGDTYESTFDEARYFEECIATEMYCNWAPPMAVLDGETQAEYFWRNWQAAQAATTASATPTSPGDPWDQLWDADATDLASDQLDLLRAVNELERPGQHPSTKQVGDRMFEMLKERGAPYFWSASAPWHGTNPAADQLRAADLIDVHVGMASYQHSDQPAETPQQYWIELTDAGRRALAAST